MPRAPHTVLPPSWPASFAPDLANSSLQSAIHRRYRTPRNRRTAIPGLFHALSIASMHRAASIFYRFQAADPSAAAEILNGLAGSGDPSDSHLLGFLIEFFRPSAVARQSTSAGLTYVNVTNGSVFLTLCNLFAKAWAIVISVLELLFPGTLHEIREWVAAAQL